MRLEKDTFTIGMRMCGRGWVLTNLHTGAVLIGGVWQKIQQAIRMPKDRIYQLSMSVGRGASASWEMSILRALYASGAKPMSVMAKAMSGIQIEKKGGASADACKADVIKTDCPQKKIRKRITNGCKLMVTVTCEPKPSGSNRP